MTHLRPFQLFELASRAAARGVFGFLRTPTSNPSSRAFAAKSDRGWHTDKIAMNELLEGGLLTQEELIASPVQASSSQPAEARQLGSGNICWGDELGRVAGVLNDSCCEPGFVPGKGHLKNKFCVRCRERDFKVPVAHLCALTPQLESEVRPRRSRFAPCTSLPLHPVVVPSLTFPCCGLNSLRTTYAPASGHATPRSRRARSTSGC